MGKATAYMEVYSGIKKRIKDEVYKPGTMLPTEAELERIYHVSRITVRRAVAMLANEGYVNVMQGKGAQVCDISTIQRLNSVTSITETFTQKGYQMSVRGMAIEEVVPPSKVREALKLEEGSTVYCLQRIMCADEIPIAIMTNYLKKDDIPDFKQHLNSFVGLYRFLEEVYGVVVIKSEEYISAASADFLESQILGVSMGTALLLSRRVGYTVKGPFEYASNKLVGDRYEFSVQLVGRAQ